MRVPSELRRPSDSNICSDENTDVEIVEAVESPRRFWPLMNVPPLDDVVVAVESLREKTEWPDWPSDESLSLASLVETVDADVVVD